MAKARSLSGNGRFESMPQLAEKTGPQHNQNNQRGLHGLNSPGYMETALTIGLMLYANGGTSFNPMGFPGYDQLYTGTYTTYRWMLKHPVIRLVRSIRMGVIASNKWEYVRTDDDDKDPSVDKWVSWTRKTFNRLRNKLIWDFLARGQDMGWQGGEILWEQDGTNLRIKRVKPLLPDLTEILEDPFGNFSGLRNFRSPDGSYGKDPVLNAPFKAWKYSYDAECDYHHGRSWLENLRETCWKDWLDGAQQLQKLGAKISGMVSIITSPAGTFPGPPGADGKPTQVSFKENALKIIRDLADGAAGAWLPSLGLTPDSKGNLDALRVMGQLVGKSLTNIEVLDFGTQAQAMNPILEKMKHAEELMFAGGLRSARVGMEAAHGSRADAGEHTTTGMFNAEADDVDFACELQPLVDANLEVNFTAKARGRVRIKPSPLVDRKASVVKAMLLALLNDQSVSARVAAVPGLMDSILKVLDITTEGDFDVDGLNEATQSQSQANKAVKNPEPQGGRPPQETQDVPNS